MCRIENDHWWFISCRDIISHLLQKYIAKSKRAIILDMGCGTGYISAELNKLGKTVSMDINEYALACCRRKNVNTLCRATAATLPFKNNSFDAVICSNVLYHNSIGDDETVLREIFRVLRKDGMALILEPAFNWLRSPHDIVECGIRRYTLSEMRLKLKKTGFEVTRSSYYIFFLFPAILILRLFKKIFLSRQPQPDLYSIPGAVNRILISVMEIEKRLLRYINLPLGSSVLCLAVK